MSILISNQQARDLLFALDYYILELEAQKQNAINRGLTGRYHVLKSLIESYNKTYHEVNANLAQELEKGEKHNDN